MIIPEIVDGCSVKCALCWNRNRRGSFRQMSLETVEKVLKRYGNVRSEVIAWFSWGEPLFYKEFVTFGKMIKGTRSCISSSFSLNVPDVYFDTLRNFETVYVSLSGLFPDVYKIYHRKGNFDLVMKNIHILSSCRCKRVVIRWLEHKYNKFQHDAARDFADRLGFQFEPTPLSCEVEELVEGFEHELLRIPKFKTVSSRAKCRQLKWIPIDVDGNYLLCCSSHNVPIGYHIDDNPTRHELIDAKMKTPLCQTCQENKYWRMF